MRRVFPLVLVLVPLAACGGGTTASGGPVGMVAPPSSMAADGVADARGGRVVVRMGDDFFRPSVVRAAAGSAVTLALRNVGQVAHAFDVSSDAQKVDVIVRPGGRTTVRVRVPRTGRLLFFCKLHWSRGMAGYLEPADRS
jgi:plastocyanin